jgi:hypothetical protein
MTNMAPTPLPGGNPTDNIPPIDLLPKQGLVPRPAEGQYVPSQPLTSKVDMTVPTPPPDRYPK